MIRPGFRHCADCGVDLVETLPEPEPAPEMVTVLETGDQNLMAVAKSVLDGAGISCAVRNERLQNLFGWGAIPAGFNIAVGPIRLQVAPEDAKAATALLAVTPVPDPDDDEP